MLSRLRYRNRDIFITEVIQMYINDTRICKFLIKHCGVRTIAFIWDCVHRQYKYFSDIVRDTHGVKRKLCDAPNNMELICIHDDDKILSVSDYLGVRT